MRRELDVTDIAAHGNVGDVEFTRCTIAAQVAPGVSGRYVVASTRDGLPAPTT